VNSRLTIQDVHDKKRVRDFNGYQSFFDFGKYGVSIVGGAQGLYGDFETTFEVAIVENKNSNFVTKLFCGGGDVKGHCSIEEVEGILNIFTGVPSPKTMETTINGQIGLPRIEDYDSEQQSVRYRTVRNTKHKTKPTQ
jgi:hypothetical protein